MPSSEASRRPATAVCCWATNVRSLRLVAANGYVTTIATGSAYSDNTFDHHGVGVLSQQPLVFDNTRPALAAAPDGSLVVASAQSIRRVARDGSVTPIAGLVGAAGFTAGSNSEAAFVGITALAIKSDGTIAVFDATGVRLVAPATNTVTTLAGATDPGSVGSVDGTGAAARFFGLTSMAYAKTATCSLPILSIRRFGASRRQAWSRHSPE